MDRCWPHYSLFDIIGQYQLNFHAKASVHSLQDHAVTISIPLPQYWDQILNNVHHWLKPLFHWPSLILCILIVCIFYIGHLVPIRHSFSGRGGSVVVHIACSGCGVQVDFASSSMSATESWRNVVSYAIRIAAFASGIGFAGYHK